MRHIHFFALVLVAAIALAACQEDGSAPDDTETEATDETSSGAEADPASEPSDDTPDEGAEAADPDVAFAEILEAYEPIRAALAADELDAIAEPAEQIQELAEKAANEAPADSKEDFEAIAEGAAGLASASDLEAARASFSELSRGVVAQVSASPKLAKEWHRFECGMWDEYPYWVQKSDELANPYMGQEMPACGSEVDWED